MYEASCSSSTTIRPSPRTGANTAERAPTTIRACAARDPLALVTPLGLGQPRVEDRDAVAEAGADAADRLRRERDLGHEHDRAEPALERRRARLEVDLGLARAGRAVEQDGAAARRRAAPTIRSTAAAARAAARRARASPGERLPLRRRRLHLAPLRRAPARRARARGRASSRSSRRATARGRRAPAAPRRRRASIGTAARRPPGGCASTPTTIPRTRRRPNGTDTIAPLPTPSVHLVGERPRHRPRRHERIDRRERHRQRSAAAGSRRLGRSGRSSAAFAARSRFQESVRAIRKSAIAPSDEVEDDDRDVHADAEREQQRLARSPRRGTGTRSVPASCPRRRAWRERASRASRRPARATRCGCSTCTPNASRK